MIIGWMKWNVVKGHSSWWNDDINWAISILTLKEQGLQVMYIEWMETCPQYTKSLFFIYPNFVDSYV